MKVEIPIDVRFADIDMQGHVNNAIYLNYFEQIRMAYFSKFVPADWDWFKNGIILARNEVEYKYPVKLTDKVKGTCTCEKVGDKSFVLKYEILIETKSGNKISATGKSTQVCYDYTNGKTIPVPDAWRENMTT